MKCQKLFRLLTVILLLLMLFTQDTESEERRRRRRRFRGRNGQRRGPRRIRHAGNKTRLEFVRSRLSKFRRANTTQDGKIRLTDGRAEWEGNVEIFHDGSWGHICDDEWDMREGEIACKELGFPDALKITYNSHYGKVKNKYWMDNLFCYGTEKQLKECRHDGWGRHDCENDEAAGVVCEQKASLTTTTEAPVPNAPLKDAPKPSKKDSLSNVFGGKLKIRLNGGRVKDEGRVEVLLPDSTEWSLICGDDWSLFEAMVVCRQIGFKYAQSAPSTGFFGGNSSMIGLSGVKCNGNEDTLNQCLHDVVKTVTCPGPEIEANIAGVTCVNKMADLVPDIIELTRSVHLEDKQLFFLQCAMEENCLSSSAYKLQDSGYGWHLETRRLLRFTARIINQGDEAFMPFLPKNHWQWHHCHMHYHSMEVFAHYDITDLNGTKIAEGHKASFCLEDNNCLPGITPVFKCANFGDQGISPGCTDTYAYSVDCQWVDISDLLPGTYTFKLSVNPGMKVAEKSFDNNAAVCDLIYLETHAVLSNCTIQRPLFDS